MRILISLAAAGLFLLGASPTFAAVCHGDMQRVTVSGTIEARRPSAGPPYRFAVLRLDEQVCYRDQDFGDVPHASSLAILPADAGALRRPWRLAGRHVTIAGSITHRITADQPPQELLLSDPRLGTGPSRPA